LRSLGYVSAGEQLDYSLTFDRIKPDAKDTIELHELNQQASWLTIGKKYDEAKEVCNQMIKLQPDSHKAYGYLGSIALAEGDIEQGLEFYQQALKLKPGSIELYEAMATALYGEKQYKLAVQYWKKALGGNPDWPIVIQKLGDAYYRMKDYPQAIEYYQRLLQFNPDYRVYSNLGMVYNLQGRLGKAMESFNSSLQLNPNQPGLLNALGDFRYNRNELDEALHYYNLSVQIVPNQPPIHGLIAKIRSRRGMPLSQ
jgi:tetratricopeptide (TPR) repeat protein